MFSLLESKLSFQFILTPTILTQESLSLQLKWKYNMKQQRTTWVSFTPKNVLFFSRYTKERIRLNFVYIRKYAPLCSYQMGLKASIENRKIYMFVSIQSDCQVTASTLLTRSLMLMLQVLIIKLDQYCVSYQNRYIQRYDWKTLSILTSRRSYNLH